jgi:hypothetical protein
LVPYHIIPKKTRVRLCEQQSSSLASFSDSSAYLRVLLTFIILGTMIPPSCYTCKSCLLLLGIPPPLHNVVYSPFVVRECARCCVWIQKYMANTSLSNHCGSNTTTNSSSNMHTQTTNEEDASSLHVIWESKS